MLNAEERAAAKVRAQATMDRASRHLARGAIHEADLAAAARRRLPAWADRIHTGNASDWTPPRRFTCVRTGLEYVPPGHEAALIARLMQDVVEPGGRLLVGPVCQADVAATARVFADAGFPAASVTSATDHNGKTRSMVWASTPAIRP